MEGHKKMASPMNDQLPIRSFMDSDKITWRYGKKPDFSVTDQHYLKTKSRNHLPGSLEKTVENLVKSFEMESTHKIKLEDWGTVDPEKFEFIVNGEVNFSAPELLEKGSYKCLLATCPYFDNNSETMESALKLFKTCFPDGFTWELLEIYSGPPVVSFSWRHWAQFTGPYKDVPPTGELLQLFGMGVAKVNDKLQIEKLEIYADNNPLLMKLSGGKCPVMK